MDKRPDGTALVTFREARSREQALLKKKLKWQKNVLEIVAAPSDPEIGTFLHNLEKLELNLDVSFTYIPYAISRNIFETNWQNHHISLLFSI